MITAAVMVVKKIVNTRGTLPLDRQAYCVGDRRKCDSIVPRLDDDDDGEMRAFFGEIFFCAGCKRLRSFR